jgi:hypothetical protein
VKVFKYPKVIDNQTLVAAGGALNTKYIPCQGAKAIVFLVVGAAVGGAPQAINTIGSGIPSGGFFAPAGLATADGVNGHALTPTNPMSVTFYPTPSLFYLGWPYLILRLIGNAGASPANDVTNVTVDAYVIYENETDKLVNGQDGLLPA